MLKEIAVGKEILSYCIKCKAPSAHIIVTMKTATKPHKVECKTCDKVHVYKDPDYGKKTKKKTGKRRTSKKQTVGEMWQTAIDKNSQDFKKYSIKTPFEKGDVIEHPSFGQGIVERIFDSNKMEVMFQSEIKTLIHNLKGS